MTAFTDTSPSPSGLRAVLRPAPPLAPEDSIARLVHLTRTLGHAELPVVANGFLAGMARLEDALPILATVSAEEREHALQLPVAQIMRPASAVARPNWTPQEVGRLCAEQHQTLIPVTAADDYCLGVVYAADLLAPDLPAPRPPHIGGMATPFGVYLTTGTIQAGVGNGALFATGMLMGLLLALSSALLQGGLWLIQKYAALPASPIYDLDFEPTARQPGLGLASIALHTVVLVVFLLLLRATRLAGYHAAEHQTVHALERNERLSPGIVRRMPRAHPRCGTNLMAAGMLFFTLLQAFDYMPYLSAGAEIFAAVATLFTWRPVGKFLQERFTTRPATEREIASGIAAGEDLMAKYLRSEPARPNALQRLWCMGLAQTMAGTLSVFGALWLLGKCWEMFAH